MAQPNTALARAVYDVEDWQAYFEERAAIREYAGGFPRHEAERLALQDAIRRECRPERTRGESNRKGSFEPYR
jgi:hypothetical protein